MFEINTGLNVKGLLLNENSLLNEYIIVPLEVNPDSYLDFNKLQIDKKSGMY